MNKANFKKKVYRKLDASPLSESISIASLATKGESKKMIPGASTKGLREELKKTFLPLMIDIFVLRQAIENYKSELESPSPIQGEKVTKSPEEILHHLEQMEQDVAESKRWCEGVTLQITKGMEEAAEVLAQMRGERRGGLLKRLLRRKKR